MTFNNVPLEFKCGVHVQILIDRSIGSSNKSSKRWIRKLISTNVEEYDANTSALLANRGAMISESPAVRLYASCNERSVHKAIRLFQHKQLEVQELDVEKFYANIHTNFVSCLMKPESRNNKNYLVDVDTTDKQKLQEVDNVVQRETVYFSYDTPNGRHYITHPFDTRLLLDFDYVEVKKDGLILLSPLREE